jgi:hypothetical protein
MLVSAVLFLIIAASFLVLHSTLYGRSPLFFVLISIAVGLAAFEIFSFPASNHWNSLILGQVLLLFLSIRASLFQQFPSSVLGDDPWYHFSFLLEIARAGHVPAASRYSDYAGIHVAVVTFAELSGFDVRTSFILTLFSFELVGFAFMFYLAKSVSNRQVAVLSTLLMTVLQTNVRWGWWITPTTVGISLMPVLVYIAVFAKPELSRRYKTIAILLMCFIILSHTLSTAVLLVLMAVLYVALRLSGWKAEPGRRRGPVPLGPVLLLLFATASWGYWVLGSRSVEDIAFAVEHGLGWNIRQFFALDVTFPEVVVTRIGADIMQALGVLGSLLMISRLDRNWKRFALSLGTLTFMGVVVAIQSPAFGEIIVASRWVGFAQLITIPAASIALYLVIILMQRISARGLFLIALISSIALVNVIAPEASFDSPLATRNNSFRFALVGSEMSGADFVARVYNGTVLTDEYFRYYPALYEMDARGLTPDNIPANSIHEKELFLLRKYVISGKLPVFTERAQGYMELPADYENLLGSSMKWNRVYSSSTLSCYV